MESKKRKREVELPRVTYDAATRTFDRLFKEDSLDAMKNVVRKKLSLSPSFPVYLSQWRDGKSVDLDDDEDFEAFSASAHSSSTVKVKVVLGGHQFSHFPDETEVVSSSVKRKRKRKMKRDVNVSSTSVAVPVEGSSVRESEDVAHQSKRQKVSFAEESSDDARTPSEEKSKKKKSKSASDDSMVVKVLSTDTEPDPEQSGIGELVKKKKKSNKTKRINEDGEQVYAAGSQSTSDTKRSHGASATPTSITVDSAHVATVSKGSSDLTPKHKKSKKRSRTSNSPERNDEDTTTSTETLGTKATPDDNERVSKKSKKKAANNAGSEIVLLPIIQSPALLMALPQPDATTTEPTKKSHKKKDKTPMTTEKPITSEALKTTPTTIAAKGVASSQKSENLAITASKTAPSKEPPAELMAITKKPTPAESNKSPVTTNFTVVDKPDNETAVKKSKKSKQKANAQETEMSGATSEKPNASLSGSKESSLVQAIAILPVGTGAKEKANKGKEKTTESKNSEGVVAKDIPSVSVAPAAKTPKKERKQKKDRTDTLEQPGTTQGKSQDQNADTPQVVDMKEVTRLIAEKIMKKVADKNFSSSPAFVQPTIHPVLPGSSSGADKSVHLTASAGTAKSSVIPFQSPTVESSELKKLADATSESSPNEPKPHPACPICNNSPLHVRSKCPIIKSGIRAMRQKIADLQKETSEEGAESRSGVILELQGIIEKRTRKPRVSEALKPIALPVPEANSESPEMDAEPIAVAVDNSKSPPPTEPTVTRLSLGQPAGELPLSVPASSSNKAKPAISVVSPKSPPSVQRNVARPSFSQPIGQLLTSTQTSSSNKVTNDSQSAWKSFPLTNKKITENSLSSELNGFGDVSLFTDKDLDALIRGPRLSVKNVVPGSDSETDEESEHDEEVVLEDDQVESRNLPRNLTRSGYPSSSDEDEEDEDEEGSHPPSPHGHSVTAAIVEEGREGGDLSFREVNALGSSVEPDRTGDFAAQAAVAADLAPLDLEQPSQGNRHKDGLNEKSDSPDSDVPTPADSPPPTAALKYDNADPIEPSDLPPASQPEPIASDDEVLAVESTPKSEVAVRTRSQRNAVVKKLDPKLSQKPVSQTNANDLEAEVEEVPKPARRTRSLMKISELPVPPNPSVRVIRQAAVVTPRTRRQISMEQNKEKEVTSEEPGLAVRTRRAAAAAKAKTPAKTPAKHPSKSTKTTAKPLSKQKAAAINVVDDEKTMGNPSNVEANLAPEDLNQTKPTRSQKGGAVSSWAILQESMPSQAETETPGMVDELLSSPNIMPAASPRDQSGKGQKPVSVNGSQRDPLFIPAESQQSFPYSQYPDIPPRNQEPASPNDSDDEDEVAAAVVKPITASINQTYRSLREIVSQPSRLFQPRLSQIMNVVQEPRIEDLYGQNGRQSEDSDSGTDSDTKDKPVSHIPASRRAGVSQPKKK